MYSVSTDHEPLQTGPFEPSWPSLERYRTPAWFQDAKFGIWAHWGPQSAPEAGDWYARGMYTEGSEQYRHHLEHYGHPSQVGFKDVIHRWRAEHWDPESLVALYKEAGAEYFLAMANHHDNFDLWDSRYQPWNAVQLGPKRDIVGEWAQAARRQGLRFGVSVHAAHAWRWYESAQYADRHGPYAGVPYDGKLTAASGRGQWWEGLEPQQLYAQNHAPSRGSDDPNAIHAQWAWGGGATVPDAAFCDTFYNRTLDLINRYDPDLLYFDDTVLPLYPVSDAGLKIAAHLYNRSLARHGEQQAVIFGKILDEAQRRALVWDIERGQSERSEPLPWQTCTCLGDWHYRRSLYDEHRYKSAKTVLQMLIDVVSKNGNLLLSVPLRGDGSLDSDVRGVVREIGAWLGVNRESIVGTRPWRVFGEGPAQDEAAPLSAEGFNEGKGKPFSAQDVRFTEKDGVVYAAVMGRLLEPLPIRALGLDAGQRVSDVTRLGSAEPVRWQQQAAALVLEPSAHPTSPADEIATVFKLTLGAPG